LLQEQGQVLVKYQVRNDLRDFISAAKIYVSFTIKN